MNSTMLFAIVSCQSYFWFKLDWGITINIHLSNFIRTFNVFKSNVIFGRELFFYQTRRKNHLKFFHISLWKVKTDLSAVSQIVKSSRSPVSAWGSSKQPNKQSWSCPIISSPLSSIINSSSVCNTEELKWFPST